MVLLKWPEIEYLKTPACVLFSTVTLNFAEI